MSANRLKKPFSVPVLQEIRGRSVTRVADDLLLSRARIVSEGAVTRPTEGSCPVYDGSTLVTIDLEDEEIAGMESAVMRDTLRDAIGRSISFRVKLMRLARLEAERRSAPLLLREMNTTLAFAIDGPRLLVDIDVECPLAEPRRSAGDRGEALS